CSVIWHASSSATIWRKHATERPSCAFAHSAAPPTSPGAWKVMPLSSARKDTTPRLPGCVRLRLLFANRYRLHFSRPSVKRSSKRLRLQEQRSTRRALPGSGMQERCSHRTKRLTMLCLRRARSSDYQRNRKHNIACYCQAPSQSKHTELHTFATEYKEI